MHICIYAYSNYNVCLHMHCMSSILLALSIKCVCVCVVFKTYISEPSYLGTHTYGLLRDMTTKNSVNLIDVMKDCMHSLKSNVDVLHDDRRY